MIEAALQGNAWGMVALRKLFELSRLSNAHVQRRAAWRAPCSAGGVTREWVRWNGLLDGEAGLSFLVLTLERVAELFSK